MRSLSQGAVSHNANYYVVSPRNTPENHPPTEACMINSKQQGVQAKCLHCVRTACILRTQRLGYSPKNTCHLFTRGKTERCQYHRVG